MYGVEVLPTGKSFCKKCGAKLDFEENDLEIKLKEFNWIGWGRSEDYLVDEVLPLIKGELQVVLIYESGDYFCGIAAKDGKVIKTDVKMILDLPKDW